MRKYPKYKESGVEWLGEIPNDWESIKLKFLMQIKNGEGLLSDKIKDHGEFEVIGGNGVLGYTNRYNVDGTTIAIGRVGAKCGNVHFLKRKAFVNDNAMVVKTNKKSVAEFLLLVLDTMNLNNLSTSTAQPLITSTAIKNQVVTIGDKEEQHSIVRFLDYKTDQIDRFITNRQKQIELLKEQKAGIINKAVTKGINPNAKMKDSGIEWIGEVPEGWGVWKLKFLTKKIGSGVTPLGGSEVYKTDGIAFFRSQNIYNDRFELSNISFIDETTHYGMRGSMILSGDVLLNITGASIGRCFYFSNEFNEANVNQHVCIIRANKNILFRFLHAVIISEIGQNQILSKQSGSNREGLNFEQLKQFDIPLPPKNEQAEILTFIEEESTTIDTLITKYQKQIDLMQEYRTSLISQAVTGKIDVRDWQPKKKAN